jgi:SPP1 gp7 family putative phage head morphogenesis protein
MAVKIRPRGQQNNNKYWRERELIQAQENKKNAHKYRQEIERVYNRALREVQADIDTWYLKYLSSTDGLSLADAKRRLTRHDIEEWRKLVDDFKAGDHSAETLARLKVLNTRARINRLEMLKAKINLKLLEYGEALTAYFHDNLLQETIHEFERQLGMTLEYRAQSIVEASFHNATWSDRIWLYQDELQQRLERIMTRALIIGENPKDNKFIKEITNAFGSTRYEASRLLVTEMARVQTDAQKASYEKNGFEYYQFICCGGGAGTNPNDPCELCKALDGKVFKVSEMMPGENASPVHPGCHCSTAAWYGPPPEE